jgi:ubiquinone/menaquinone biosynthesis C-methylase UbiE
MTSESWRTFWGGSHSIYVNSRHAQVHYERLAADIMAVLAPRERPRVLDWGCGDALNAATIARRCGELLLYDAVPAVQERLAESCGKTPGVRVLSDGDWRTLQAGSVDVIILNSVAQYLTREELAALLDEFRRVVHPQGEVLLADIIPPDAGMLPDVLSLLRLGWRSGFLLAAGAGLVRTFFSDYRRVRQQAGFSTYTSAEFLELLAAHGFEAQRLPANIGFSVQRMAFCARPRPAVAGTPASAGR